MGVFLLLELELLLEGGQLGIVVVEGAADEAILFCELLLEFGEEIVELVVLLVQVGAILPKFVDFLCPFTV